MTEAEFKTFVQHVHGGNFNTFAAWFWGSAGEPVEAARTRYSSWFAGLKHLTLDEAQDASLEMLCSEEKPEGYTNHLAWLRGAAGRIRLRKRETNQPLVGRAYGCERCRDTGMVEVTAKPGMCIFTIYRNPMPHGKWTVVDCDCASAVQYTEGYQGPRRDKWTASRMETRPPVDPQESWALIAELREKGEHRKANAWERFLNGGVLPTSEILNGSPE